MRMRKKKWVDTELEECDFFIKNPKEHKGKWNEIFSKSQPMYLELGCGKGQFISNIANGNDEINFIGIDMISTMLGLAKRNVELIYNSKEINNIVLASYDIERILEILDEKDKISRIYINFCNPWPKSQHKKRRLTHTRQLEKYKEFLMPNGEIHFKTDDDELFKDSIRYFEDAGFEILEKSYEYRNENDIKTEHQKMFEQQGIKTKFLRASLNKRDNV